MNCFALISGNTIAKTAFLCWFLSDVKRPFEVVYEAPFDDQSGKQPGDFFLVAELTEEELISATGIKVLTPGENYIDAEVSIKFPQIFEKSHLIFLKERGNNSWREICYRKDLLPIPVRPVKEKA